MVLKLQEEGNESQQENESIEEMELGLEPGADGGEVEYLEVETLDEIEYRDE